MSLDRILEQLRTEVDYFIASAIVDTSSGLALASTSIDPNFDPAVASPSYAEVVKSNGRALDLLGMDPRLTEDILITTSTAYLLIRMLGGYHHGLAVAKAANLGLTRVIMKKYEPLFMDTLRSLGATR